MTYPLSAVAVCFESDAAVVDGSVGPPAAAAVANTEGAAGARASAFPETGALVAGLDHTAAQSEAADAAMLGVGVAEAAKLDGDEPDSGTSSTAATEPESGTSSAAATAHTSWHPTGPAAIVVAAAEGVAQASSHFEGGL